MAETTKTRRMSFGEAKKTLKSFSPANILSLSGYINPFLDVFFAMALIFALLKDLLDVTVGLIPVVGQILALVISILCGIFIFLIMLILGASQMKAIAKRSIIIFLGSLADAIPGVGIIPFETVVVIVTYLMILNERKKIADEQRKAQSSAQENYAY